MRALLAIWLTAVLALTGVSGRGQSGAPVTESAYWELIRSTRQAVVEADALTEGAAVRGKLDALASQWEAVTAVELPGGDVAFVDPSYLVDALRADPPGLERLSAQLDVLLQAHEEYPRGVFTVQSVEPLREILSRPEFQWREAPARPAPDWLERILGAIADFFEWLNYGIQRTLNFSRVPLIVAAVLLFVVSLYFISRNLARNLVREAQMAAGSGDGAEFITSSGALQRAQSLSQAGDYRNAVRYLYLSSLLTLDERGLLRYDRSRTNREYLRSISARPELSAPLKDVIDVFDRVWYGFEPLDENTYQAYVKHVDELREKKE